MADRIRDAEDEMLSKLFAAEPIADAGFSDRIVRRIERRLWVRRITLPVAAIAGAAVSAKPLGSLVTGLFDAINAIPLPTGAGALPTDVLPSLPMLVLGAALFGVMMLGLRVLED